jgi:hypothetical protein
MDADEVSAEAFQYNGGSAALGTAPAEGVKIWIWCILIKTRKFRITAFVARGAVGRL